MSSLRLREFVRRLAMKVQRQAAVCQFHVVPELVQPGCVTQGIDVASLVSHVSYVVPPYRHPMVRREWTESEWTLVLKGEVSDRR